jgi:hypothetical protein
VLPAIKVFIRLRIISQNGKTPRKMTFDDRAFDFIPWAQPLSDPRKAQITVKQLLNHTSGICPEATGAIASPTRGDDHRHLSPPHFSVLHFSAIPFSVFFGFFLLSPKNHLSVLSVSRKKEKTKECGRPVLASLRVRC